MKKIKIKNLVSLVLLVSIILLTCVFFIYQAKKSLFSTSPTKVVSPSEPNINTSQIPKEVPKNRFSSEVFSSELVVEEWTEISRDSYWDRTELFASGNPWKFPPIKFSYPSNWHFRCCDGMDFNTLNTIFPVDSEGKSYEVAPSIRIIQIGLAGCPHIVGNCSLEKIMELDSKETYERRIKNLPENSKVLPKTFLRGINKYVFSYSHTVPREEKSAGYEALLFEVEDELVEVQFVRPGLIDAEMKEKFLSSIQYDRSFKE